MSLNKTKSFDLEYSVQELKKVDPALTEMFNQVQVNPLEPEKNYFQSLTRVSMIENSFFQVQVDSLELGWTFLLGLDQLFLIPGLNTPDRMI